MGRLFARLLLAAFKSPHVQGAAVEVSRYVARRAAAFLIRKLRAKSSTYNDDSKGRRVGAGGEE